MENQKRNFKTEKKGSKMNGEKKERQKGEKMGKKWEKHGFVHLHFFACILLFRFLFVFFPGKKNTIKAKKQQIEKTKKCKQNANGQIHFFPFLYFLFSPFFPLLFCFCVFLDFADLLFGFSFFVAFVSVFSSLLILRISYGLVNITIIGLKACR